MRGWRLVGRGFCMKIWGGGVGVNHSWFVLLGLGWVGRGWSIEVGVGQLVRRGFCIKVRVSHW